MLTHLRKIVFALLASISFYAIAMDHVCTSPGPQTRSFDSDSGQATSTDGQSKAFTTEHLSKYTSGASPGGNNLEHQTLLAFSLDGLSARTPGAVAPQDKLGSDLLRACEHANRDWVNELIAQGVDVNWCPPRRSIEYYKGSPLIQAVRNGSQKIIATLLEAHANPNQLSQDGYTPLLEAVSSGGLYCSELFQDITRTLIDAKGDITIESKKGANALSQAARSGASQIMELLIQEAGADLYHRDSQQKTALIHAAEGKKRESVQFIIYDLITALSPHEKDLIKTWCFVTKKMQIKYGIFMPKDMRIFMAHEIRKVLAQELYKRTILAGGSEAFEFAQQNNAPKIAKDLTRFMDMNFLCTRVRRQTTWLK